MFPVKLVGFESTHETDSDWDTAIDLATYHSTNIIMKCLLDDVSVEFRMRNCVKSVRSLDENEETGSYGPGMTSYVDPESYRNIDVYICNRYLTIDSEKEQEIVDFFASVGNMEVGSEAALNIPFSLYKRISAERLSNQLSKIFRNHDLIIREDAHQKNVEAPLYTEDALKDGLCIKIETDDDWVLLSQERSDSLRRVFDQLASQRVGTCIIVPEYNKAIFLSPTPDQNIDLSALTIVRADLIKNSTLPPLYEMDYLLSHDRNQSLIFEITKDDFKPTFSNIRSWHNWMCEVYSQSSIDIEPLDDALNAVDTYADIQSSFSYVRNKLKVNKLSHSLC